MPPRAPSITLTFDLNELREVESGLSGVLGGYDEITELHHRNGDEAGASRIHKESLAARRAYKRVVEAIKASTYEKIAHIADRNSGSKRGLSSGKSRATRDDVAKARAAMTAAAAEMTARDRLQRDQTRNVRIAVAALSMRPQGVRPASMGEVDVYEALARHGLAEATGRGNTHRTGHLTAIASTLLTAQDHADALAALEDAPQH